MRTRNNENLEEITQTLIAGRKTEAIKIYRDATCVGRKEAMESLE